MGIRSFALTYPQFMNQAWAQGMDEQAISRLRSAYDLAEKWFDGFYRGQGTPFICHLVRTSSIVLAERQPIDVVIASLLHAAYLLGQFQDGREKRASPKQRTKLRQAVGAEVEEIVWDYHHLPWHSAKALNHHLEKFSTYEEKARRLLVMRLSNELEDYLDLAMVYRGANPFREEIRAYGKQYVEVAYRLGLSQLAEELHEVFEAHRTCQLPKVALRNYHHSYKLKEHRPKSTFSDRAVRRAKQLFMKVGVF